MGGHPFQLDGRDTAHGFHPPWSRSNHATNEASMLRCRNDGKSHFAGTGVLGGNHMPTGHHEWCLIVHESASRMRLRGKSARRHTTDAGESLSARFLVFWFRIQTPPGHERTGLPTVRV